MKNLLMAIAILSLSPLTAMATLAPVGKILVKDPLMGDPQKDYLLDVIIQNNSTTKVAVCDSIRINYVIDHISNCGFSAFETGALELLTSNVILQKSGESDSEISFVDVGEEILLDADEKYRRVTGNRREVVDYCIDQSSITASCFYGCVDNDGKVKLPGQEWETEIFGIGIDVETVVGKTKFICNDRSEPERLGTTCEHTRYTESQDGTCKPKSCGDVPHGDPMDVVVEGVGKYFRKCQFGIPVQTGVSCVSTHSARGKPGQQQCLRKCSGGDYTQGETRTRPGTNSTITEICEPANPVQWQPHGYECLSTTRFDKVSFGVCAPKNCGSLGHNRERTISTNRDTCQKTIEVCRYGKTYKETRKILGCGGVRACSDILRKSSCLAAQCTWKNTNRCVDPKLGGNDPLPL